MVVLGADGSLTLVAADGRATPLAPADDNPVTFPAWSPDGTRIAAIRLGAGLDGDRRLRRPAGGDRGAVEPTVILRSSTIGPFYLSWSPDGRTVSYLAEEPNGLSLRLAPADGSAPIDGSGPGSRVREREPVLLRLDRLGPAPRPRRDRPGRVPRRDAPRRDRGGARAGDARQLPVHRS